MSDLINEIQKQMADTIERLEKELAETKEQNKIEKLSSQVAHKSMLTQAERAEKAEHSLQDINFAYENMLAKMCQAERERDELRAQVAVLAEALKFYADGDHFEPNSASYGVSLLDSGGIAGKALSSLTESAKRLMAVVEAAENLLIHFSPEHLDKVSGSDCGTRLSRALKGEINE